MSETVTPWWTEADVKRVARFINGPSQPVPPGSKFTLEHLQEVRWAQLYLQEQGERLAQARAALSAMPRPDDALREAQAEIARLRGHLATWVRYMGDESDEKGDAQFEHDWMMETRRIAALANGEASQ